MYGLLDVSTSGMVANRVRLTAIASNIANRNAMFDEKGELNPYRARRVHLEAGDPTATTAEGRALGVHVAAIDEDPSDYTWRYDPGNPYAMKEGARAGYVPESNVNVVFETMNALEATRAYEANVVAAEAAKTMAAQALRLLA